MDQTTLSVNFPTKNKLAQDKHISNVKSIYSKDGNLMGITIDFQDVGDKKKPALWTINVDNRSFTINPTDLHDRYEGLYYFCMSSNVTKQSLKEADFGVDYLISILEKLHIQQSDTKIINLITSTPSILLITKSKTRIIPICDIEDKLFIAIKDAKIWRDVLDYNKESTTEETQEEKLNRRKDILTFLNKYISNSKYANITHTYRFD